MKRRWFPAGFSICRTIFELQLAETWNRWKKGCGGWAWLLMKWTNYDSCLIDDVRGFSPPQWKNRDAGSGCPAGGSHCDHGREDCRGRFQWTNCAADSTIDEGHRLEGSSGDSRVYRGTRALHGRRRIEADAESARRPELGTNCRDG